MYRACFLLLLMPLLLGCSSTKSLESTWLDRPITIDGYEEEWSDQFVPFDKEAFSLGLTNDEAYLYVSLFTTDQTLIRQIRGGGLTLWFDPDGGKAKTFGIRFPLGLMNNQPGGRPSSGPPAERTRQRQRSAMLDVRGPGEDVAQRMTIEEARAWMELEVSTDNRALVYELKVPLHTSGDHAFAIGAEAGTTIGVGLETGEVNRQSVRPQGGGNRGGGRGGRGGGGRGGRGGNLGGPGGPQQAAPLKVWTTVALSDNN